MLPSSGIIRSIYSQECQAGCRDFHDKPHADDGLATGRTVAVRRVIAVDEGVSNGIWLGTPSCGVFSTIPTNGTK